MVDRRLKNSFRKISLVYDEVRPDYPSELIEMIIAFSHLPSNGRVLEIGTGTGKATKKFAEKGYQITALDISEELLSIAKTNLSLYPNVQYLVSSFEDAKVMNGEFDLVFAAQAFHWIDPSIGFVKAHSCLKEGGYLALFSNFQEKNTDLERAMRLLYQKYCPQYPGDEYGTLQNLQQQFDECHLFGRVERRAYLRDVEYSREAYRKLIGSFSWVSTLSTIIKDQFFAEVESILGESNSFTIPTESILLIAQKKLT